ncbi:pectin acetylesterase [Trifolium medium]|uniref:Pectin acetylesterase n=1 Tax=Trifolium medium TaxID=97028 RepID=A0A392PQA6_9FABA|nr:pectin acetylesterase [Trifolium medium]
MGSFSIPWACLDTSSKPDNSEKTQPKPHKSFAQAVSNVCDIPLSQLPQACVKGVDLAIPIPEVEYLAGIDACKHNLHGRIIWPKGATPLTVVALKNKLAPIWKDLAKWGVSSLGKGFYEFCFSSLEDVRRVRSVASWALNPVV